LKVAVLSLSGFLELENELGIFYCFLPISLPANKTFLLSSEIYLLGELESNENELEEGDEASLL
jgi:hypothetical protein